MGVITGAKYILGKTIRGVIVKSGRPSQVFLVFDDDTYFEFYSTDGHVTSASGVDPGGSKAARSYMQDHQVIKYEIYLDDGVDEEYINDMLWEFNVKVERQDAKEPAYVQITHR